MFQGLQHLSRIEGFEEDSGLREIVPRGADAGLCVGKAVEHDGWEATALPFQIQVGLQSTDHRNLDVEDQDFVLAARYGLQG